MDGDTRITPLRQPGSVGGPPTGKGALDLRRPKGRDRAADVPGKKRIRVPPAILPRRVRGRW